MASTLVPIDSNPLLSAVVSFCLLLLLYAPHILLRLLLSPVIVSAGALLVGILHLGSTKKPLQLEHSSTQATTVEEDGECGKEEENEKEVVPRPRRRFSDVLVEWNRRAPLEVIYENEYEGEGGDEEAVVDGGRPEYYSSPARERKETCALQCYYPESDSDSSSDDGFPAMWERPDNRCFRWEDDNEDGLIEIPIFKAKDTCRSPAEELDFYLVDDDNLIEIDLFDQTVVKSQRFPAKIEAAAQC
ncbi:uncharacterized protein LOC116264787 [Nymphaea colorata]|uniref:uncharacterized protein LOC116264787 n=1 Tax=Nymphaea colorata TaxID=210225 RepID=UPI00129ECE19|nr:uncharacterized protein LOC116264787 [Nymphaea colorata]